MSTFKQIMSLYSKLLASTFSAICLIAFNNTVFAAGTLANTSISNTATLAYDVNGVTQADITSPAAIFLVDRKINLTTGEVGGTPSIVGPGQLIAITTFSVTNTGNDTQDFSFSTANLANGTIIFNNTSPLSDSFNANGCASFVENGTNPGYQAAEDISIFIDELLPDLSKTVYVVCSIPPAQALNTVAIVSLTTNVLSGGTTGVQGAALTNNALIPNSAGIDTVFANPTLTLSADGTIPAQAGNNASAVARDAYRVVSVVTNVTKSASCSPAPANCSEAKTGTVVTYQLLINITGSGSADALVITDPLPANLTYLGGLIVPPSAISSDFGVTTPNTLTVNFGTVVSPANLTIQFNARIN